MKSIIFVICLYKNTYMYYVSKRMEIAGAHRLDLSTVTHVSGVFERPEVKQEFYQLIKLQG